MDTKTVFTLWVIVLGVFLLSGCDKFVRTETVVVEVPKLIEPPPAPVYPRPNPVRLHTIPWFVLGDGNKGEFDEWVQGASGAAICLAPKDYETLGVNMQKILRYLRDSSVTFDKYEARNKKKSSEGVDKP